MKFLTRGMKMLFVGSYTPRRCGIATFTNDLYNAIQNMFGDTLPMEICAVQNQGDHIHYGTEVTYILHSQELDNYRIIAEKINEREDIGLICIQHEFGLHGGDLGGYLLTFLLTLNKPVATVFHTVLPNPDELRKKIVQTIDILSDRLIVLTKRSEKLLENEYGCSSDKVTHIPHGTHTVLWEKKIRVKRNHEYKNKIVLSTFGLISENKNIEKALFALKDVVKIHPDIVYMVIGKTHPEVIKKEGEKYRRFLLKITQELGLQKHVVFINEYLDLKKLLEYLILSDIYLFTSKDPNQAVSGTLVYAFSCGCAVISNPIPHAIETLAGGDGLLLKNFEDDHELGEKIIDLLKNSDKRSALAQNAFAKIRSTSWENIALKYGLLFGKLTERIEDLRFNIPQIKLDHVKKMTTDVGILQFSNFSQPDPNSGYTLDDNARALINMVMYFDQYGNPNSLQYLNIYLTFLEKMQRESGWFDNYLNYELQLTDQNAESNLDDANGRAIWSLGYTIAHQDILPPSYLDRAINCWNKVFDKIEGINSPRAMAYSIKGLYQYYSTYPQKHVKNKIILLTNKLMDHYRVNSERDWQWYEDIMTYANNVLPEAMMYSFLATRDTEYKKIAVTTFDFLLSQYFMKRQIKVISNRGWFKRKNARNFYGEQPMEVVTTIITLDLFYQVTKHNKYLDQLEIAFSWFLGNNHLHQIMYNPENGASYDGLEDKHVNINQGAESSLCFMKAQMILDKYLNKIKDNQNTKKPLIKSELTTS